MLAIKEAGNMKAAELQTKTTTQSPRPCSSRSGDWLTECMVLSSVKRPTTGPPSMPDKLSEIPIDAIRTAAERLVGIGVYADEERQYPSVSTLRAGATELDAKLRSNGYSGGPIAIAYLERPHEGVDFLIYDSTKISDVSGAESIWYQDYRIRWHDRVMRRVSDWINRLQDLKELFEKWLPNGMQIVDRAPVKMHEELMRKFNVPAQNVPTFEVVQGSNRVMRFQPKGLWIVGANGRVDLVTGHGSWILVDRSTPLATAPDWFLYSSKAQPAEKLTQSSFVNLLKQSG